MAGERTPGTKPEADKPAANAAVAGAAKNGKGGALQAWLPLIVTIAIMPLLAYAMTRFMIVPKLQKSLGLTTTHAEPAAAETHGGKEPEGGGHGAPDASGRESVTMSKVLVNVAGTMGSRYLLSSYVIAGKGPEFRAKFEKNLPQLLDLAGSTLQTKTISDLEKSNARNLIRSELITAFNSVLGNSAVQDVFITEFAIQ